MQSQKTPKTVKVGEEESRFFGRINRTVIKAEEWAFKAVKIGDTYIIRLRRDDGLHYVLVKPYTKIWQSVFYTAEGDLETVFEELIDAISNNNKIEHVDLKVDAYLIREWAEKLGEDYYWLVEWQNGDSVYVVELDLDETVTFPKILPL